MIRLVTSTSRRILAQPAGYRQLTALVRRPPILSTISNGKSAPSANIINSQTRTHMHTQSNTPNNPIDAEKTAVLDQFPDLKDQSVQQEVLNKWQSEISRLQTHSTNGAMGLSVSSDEREAFLELKLRHMATCLIAQTGWPEQVYQGWKKDWESTKAELELCRQPAPQDLVKAEQETALEQYPELRDTPDLKSLWRETVIAAANLRDNPEAGKEAGPSLEEGEKYFRTLHKSFAADALLDKKGTGFYSRQVSKKDIDERLALIESFKKQLGTRSG